MSWTDELIRIAGTVAKGKSDPREWAKKLQQREQQGANLTPFQRHAWRHALGQEKEGQE